MMIMPILTKIFIMTNGHLPMMTIIIVMMFKVYLCCNIPRLVLNLAEVIAEVNIRCLS